MAFINGMKKDIINDFYNKVFFFILVFNFTRSWHFNYKRGTKDTKGTVKLIQITA